MLRMLVWKEFTGHLLTVRFLACLLLCLTLGLASLGVLMMQYEMIETQVRRERLRHRMDLDGATPDDVRWRGFFVDRDSPALRIFHVGLDDMLSRSVSDSVFWGQRYESSLNANPVFLLFPTLDTTYVVGVVMSLMAFVLCYDSISGEIEEGTLALTLSFPVPKDLLLLSKWIGAVLAAGLPLLVTMLTGVALVLTTRSFRLAPGDWAAVGAAFGAGMLYLGLACALAIWISASVRNSATSIAVLLLIWVLMAVVIPNLSPYLAEWISPIPSVQSMESEKQEARRAVMDEFFARYRKLRRLKDPEERARQQAALQRELSRRITAEQARIENSYQRRLEAQTRWAQAISRLSPYAAFVYAVTALGDTGIRAREEFFGAVNRYERIFYGYVDEMISANQKAGRQNWEPDAERIDLRAMPAWDPPGRPFPERAAEASVDFLELGLGTVLFGMLAHRRFTKLRFR